MLILPGNHDVNIVDRANPARLDLPTSPGKRLRQMRTLSAMAAVQGGRVRVVDPDTGTLGGTLTTRWPRTPPRSRAFADAGSLRLSLRSRRSGPTSFRWCCRRLTEDGLGIMLLNSNAETHFSFTNALGLVSAEQARGSPSIAAQYPAGPLDRGAASPPRGISQARPRRFSERIGTALINGSWFVRQLQPLGRSAAWRCTATGTSTGSAPAAACASSPRPPPSWRRRTTQRPLLIHTLRRARTAALALLAAREHRDRGEERRADGRQCGSP